MFKKVLVPLDGSSLAEKALEHLPLLFTPKETEIVLIKVIEFHKFIIVVKWNSKTIWYGTLRKSKGPHRRDIRTFGTECIRHFKTYVI